MEGMYQQKEKGRGALMLGGIAVILAILAATFYFLFFAAPPRIEVVLPRSLEAIAELSKISLDPSAVLGSEAFRSLKSYNGLPSVGRTGRTNPFIDYR